MAAIDRLDNFTIPAGESGEVDLSKLYFFDGLAWRRVSAADPLPVTGGGGGGVGITDTDDNSIAPLQTTLLAIDINYIFDGATWIRWQGGVDNAVAPASPQGGFIAGVARTVLPVYLAGDVVVPNFDTSGRLITATTNRPGTVIAAGANTAVGVGLTVPLPVPPPGTLAITVQNNSGGAGASRVAIRQVGGAAGTGIRLNRFSAATFDKSIAALEAQWIVGVAATVSIIFEVA